MVNGPIFGERKTLSNLNLSKLIERSINGFKKGKIIPPILFKFCDYDRKQLELFNGGKIHFLELSIKGELSLEKLKKIRKAMDGVKNCYPFHFMDRIILISYSKDFVAKSIDCLTRANSLLKMGKTKEAELLYKALTEIMIPRYAISQIINTTYSSWRQHSKLARNKLMADAMGQASAKLKTLSRLLETLSTSDPKKINNLFSDAVMEYQKLYRHFQMIMKIADYSLFMDNVIQGSKNRRNDILRIKGKKARKELMFLFKQKIDDPLPIIKSYFQKALDSAFNQRYEESQQFEAKALKLLREQYIARNSFHAIQNACIKFEQMVLGSKLKSRIDRLKQIWESPHTLLGEKTIAKSFYLTLVKNIGSLWFDIDSYSISSIKSIAKSKKDFRKDPRYSRAQEALASAESLLWRFFIPSARIRTINHRPIGESERATIERAMGLLRALVKDNIKSKNAREKFEEQIKQFLKEIKSPMKFSDASEKYLKFISAYINSSVYESKAQSIINLYSKIEEIQRRAKKDGIELTDVQKAIVGNVYMALGGLPYVRRMFIGLHSVKQPPTEYEKMLKKSKELKIKLPKHTLEFYRSAISSSKPAPGLFDYNPFRLSEEDTKRMVSAEYLLKGLRAVLWTREFPREVLTVQKSNIPFEEGVILFKDNESKFQSLSYRLDPTKLKGKKQHEQFRERILASLKFIYTMYDISREKEDFFKDLGKLIKEVESRKKIGKAFDSIYLKKLVEAHDFFLSEMQLSFNERSNEQMDDRLIKEAKGIRKFFPWMLKYLRKYNDQITIFLIVFSLGTASAEALMAREAAKVTLKEFFKSFIRKETRKQILLSSVHRTFQYYINLQAITGMFKVAYGATMLISPGKKELTEHEKEYFMLQYRQGALDMTLGRIWGTKWISRLSLAAIPAVAYSLSQRKPWERMGKASDILALSLHAISLSPLLKLAPRLLPKGMQRTIEGRALIREGGKLNLKRPFTIRKPLGTKLSKWTVAKHFLVYAPMYGGAQKGIEHESEYVLRSLDMGTDLIIPDNSLNFWLLHDYALFSNSPDAVIVRDALENHFWPYLRVFTYITKKGKEQSMLLFMGRDFDQRYKRVEQELMKKLKLSGKQDLALHIKKRLDEIISGGVPVKIKSKPKN